MLLRLNAIEVRCVIGDLPEERTREQLLRVDVELRLKSERSAFSDSLADTVDYAALAQAIRISLQSAQCRLVERAAKLALAECLKSPLVAAAKVEVTKSGAVPGLGSASVVVEG